MDIMSFVDQSRWKSLATDRSLNVLANLLSDDGRSGQGLNRLVYLKDDAESWRR